MTTNLFFGNLPYRTGDEDLRALVSQYTTVLSARVATDRDTGRSRGFGFVEVPAEAAEAVVRALNGVSLEGRALTVNQARPREERPRAAWDSGRRGGR
ncbi:MAG: RNA-binding protein [Dehalococcoidia bacterium]